MIEISITAADKKAAKLAAIRFANAKGGHRETDYADRDVSERAYIGALGEIAFARHMDFAPSREYGYDALDRVRDLPVEIKVKTKPGLREVYDIQKCEMAYPSLIFILYYDETAERLYLVGRSHMSKVKPNPAGNNGLLFRRDIEQV